MSRKFQVELTNTASAVVNVYIIDERLEAIAAKLGVPVDELSLDDLTDEIMATYEEPRICAQCGGWGEIYDFELSEIWSEEDITEVK